MQTHPDSSVLKKGNRRPLNLTMSDEVRSALEDRAAATGLSVSRLVGALAKIYCGLPTEDVERPIETSLKRIIGREQFLAFLNGVSRCLDETWTPLTPAEEGRQPESWVHASGIGVLAFFAANEENLGRLITTALVMKTGCHLTGVIVCTADGEALPAGIRDDLKRIGIFITPLGGLREAVGLARGADAPPIPGAQPRSASPSRRRSRTSA